MIARAGAALLALPLLAGCANIAQAAYDERARDECEALRDLDAQRACLDSVDEDRHARNRD